MSYWSKLSMKDRANVMKLFLDKGISDLDTMRREYNIFAGGGSIHIDPSKKGTFTAAASKHGMGVQEFASKVLANKENYSPAMVKKANFARNASKWHGFGGNLYDGTSEDSQQMTRPNIFQRPDGSYFYSADGVETDVSPINVLGDNPAQWTYSDASGKIYRPVQALPNNYTLTETEDANPLERAANNYFRELDWRAKNDPSSIALQGKYTMPLVLSPMLGKAAATALANPYVDAALTSGFGAHGLNHAINEGIDGWGDAAMTALELAPLGRLVKPMWNAVKPTHNFIPTLESTASGYSINLQDALDNPAFDFTPTGVPRTWWDIMSKRRPDVALSRWEKLGKDLDVKNPIYTDRAGAKDAKNIFNSDWYQKRLNDRVSNPEEVTSTFNTRIDKTPLLIQDPGTGFGMEAAGKNISKVERGIGLDGKEKVIVDNKILLHPDMIGKTGDYKYFPENYLDDVVKHETLHSSSGTGLALPTEVRANNYKYHMTPKYSRESNPSMYDYMSVDDEQRVRLLKFAELAETKFGGDYNKAFDYANDHYYTWAKDGISHDVMDLVTNFNKEDVVKSASNILGWLAPILTGATLYGKQE